MTIDGYGPYQIASKLKSEKVLIQMCIRDSLCGLYTAFTVTLMHKNFLDKLVEHSNGQLVEVLVFVNQSDKTVSVLSLIHI